MSLDSMITDGVYSTLVAEDATYVDASGAETAVRVIPVHDPAVLFSEAEVGVRGSQKAFRLRKSELTITPSRGDRIEQDGSSFCVDGKPDDINQSEWLIYVTA